MMQEKGPEWATNLNAVSKLASEKWKSLDSEQKEIYGTIAEVAAELHQLIFPNYIYSSNRSLHDHMYNDPMYPDRMNTITYHEFKNHMYKHNQMNTISKPIELATSNDWELIKSSSDHYDKKLIKLFDKNFFFKT
ncbi:hypothetical protein Glove_21g128 [Diversispora epigaea]|uniref:HMG box domain-containing protein n=1 Tax=Diversispora epigaea TaxID=1348612 RepID=A0A397JJY5_9GLOM|nr:hypothetical protein Glove_21g128 [Diversispora epigaea]